MGKAYWDIRWNIFAIDVYAVSVMVFSPGAVDLDLDLYGASESGLVRAYLNAAGFAYVWIPGRSVFPYSRVIVEDLAIGRNICRHVRSCCIYAYV